MESKSTIERILVAFNAEYPLCIVSSIHRYGPKYLCTFESKNKEEQLRSNACVVDLTRNTVSSINIFSDLEGFKKAINSKPIYRRQKT